MASVVSIFIFYLNVVADFHLRKVFIALLRVQKGDLWECGFPNLGLFFFPLRLFYQFQPLT